MLTLSQKVDECKPLLGGITYRPFWRQNMGSSLHSSTSQLNLSRV